MPGINGEFVPDPGLAQSNAHHHSMGSSHRNQPDTPENWHRPTHEFMTDEELAIKIARQLRTVRENYAKLEEEKAIPTSGMRHVEMYRMIRDDFLMPNLYYLAAIKRLPEGIDIAAIEVELTIPEGIE